MGDKRYISQLACKLIGKFRPRFRHKHRKRFHRLPIISRRNGEIRIVQDTSIFKWGSPLWHEMYTDINAIFRPNSIFSRIGHCNHIIHGRHGHCGHYFLRPFFDFCSYSERFARRPVPPSSRVPMIVSRSTFQRTA